jgi:hypothetical protein
MDKQNYSHLLANPYFFKKKNNVKFEIENDVVLLLHKLFPEYNITDIDGEFLIKRLDNFCKDLYIEHIVNDLLNEIIQKTIDQNV